MLEWLIKNATIVDGLGTPPQVGDLAIRNDRISEIGQLNDVKAKETRNILETMLLTRIRSNLPRVWIGSL